MLTELHGDGGLLSFEQSYLNGQNKELGMDNPLKGKDPKTYTVFGLLNAGARFTDGFDPDDAIAMYLERHPEAVEAEVRAELMAELERRGLLPWI